MSSFLFVHTSPTSSDVEEEFDHWYDTVHIPQVVARVAGVVGGTRHVEAPLSTEAAAVDVVRRRLTIYELDHDDVAATMASLAEAMGDGSLETSPLIDREVNPPQVSAWRIA